MVKRVYGGRRPASHQHANHIEDKKTFIAPTGEPVIASEVPKAFGIKKPPMAPIAEIKPSAAAVSVTASCCASSSLPPRCFTLSMVSWRKMTAIIWKVEPLPRPAVKKSPINTT